MRFPNTRYTILSPELIAQEVVLLKETFVFNYLCGFDGNDD